MENYIMRTHTKRFNIRLTEKEYNRLCKNAKKAGLPKTTYIRHMINGCSPREKTPAVFWQYINKSNEVINNTKNLLYMAQQMGVIDADRFEKEIRDFRKLYMAIFDEVVLPEKVDVKATLERGRLVAENDKNELE